MRAGVCAAQQTLSAEAASVLKHSLSLARRRGHAQVTPLHVAATLLSTRASLLRRACLKSQPHQPSHPLQCRALELCFNVALNRLPATPGPFLHAQPSLSNALIAALKRAQAHQRRGCIEQQQQQPLIAIKVELEQLILSILDDPSVSRVMREAGFSSTAVKNHLEESANSVSSVFQCYNTSGGVYSTPNSPPTETLTQRDVVNSSSFWHSHLMSYASRDHNNFLLSPQKSTIIHPVTDSSSSKEDIKVVMEVLLRKKRRNIVIVGDTLTMAEALVSELMGKVERGDVPEELKSAQSIKFQFSSIPLSFMKREEVEMNIADLKRKVDSYASTGRVIIYTGDLKWTVEGAVDEREGGFCAGKEAGGYSPVDHLISEIGKLLSWYESSSDIRVWLIATASYQTYMKCQMKQPSLDAQWTLQAVSVPSGGLGLSLSASSGQNSRTSFLQNPSQTLDKKLFNVKEEHDVLTCCQECKSNYEKEAAFNSNQRRCSLINKDTEKGSAHLPYWLQSHSTLEKDNLVQLRRKYNSMCLSLHQGSHHPNNFSSVITNPCNPGKNYFHTSSYPSWQNKNTIHGDPDQTISFSYPAIKPNQSSSPLPRFRRQQSCHIEFSFSNEYPKYHSVEPNLDCLKSMDGKDVKITLALGNSEYTDDPRSKKIEANADLCENVRKNVPWQSETVPLIVEALMDETIRRDKFLLIKGNDAIGKRRLAFAIAEYMFGSSALLFCMNMRKNSNTVTQNREMLESALEKQELVILVEDIESADPEFVKFLVKCFETGKLETLSREQRDLGRVIFILTVEDENTNYNMDRVIQMKFIVEESRIYSGMPNLDQKRKADWDLPFGTKIQRNNEMEEVTSHVVANGKRELSTHFLDLNVKADEDESKEEKPGEFSSNSSNSTCEVITMEQQSPLTFLKKIKNRFVFNRDLDQDKQARETFLSKFRTHFQEANGSRNFTKFNVEDMVLEEVVKGSSFHLNNLFEQWLKDVFQTSVRMVVNGEGEMVSVRLCLGGRKGTESCAEDGYMGTCLPKRIQVCFIG